jgi:LPS sulfotransferase NodH
MRRFVPDYPEAVDAQLAIAHRVGTTANGCFAMKMHPAHVDRLLQGGSVAAAFFNPVFVRLYRRDLVAQAVSLYRARASDRYHAFVAAEREVEFDGEAIRQCLFELVRSRGRWEVYFARNGIEPLAIAYEDLAADPYTAVGAIGRRVGEAVGPQDVVVTAPLRVQRDDISALWKQRFFAAYRDLDLLDAL